MRLLIAVLAAATSLAILSSVVAAGADVRITALDCGSHPRRVRIENVGDAAQDLSGWQLQTLSGDGGPFDLGRAGSLDAGKRFFVFQGHLSPPENPDVGYYRWGSSEIFNLRANDSSDFVRIVDPQGNTVNQRNCEGLPPGATPAPPSEFDPPPVVTPGPATPTPAPIVAPPPVNPVPTATARANPAQVAPTVRASGSALASTTPTQAGVPAVGGPPGPDQSPESIPLVAGAIAIAAGALFVALGFKRSRREL